MAERYYYTSLFSGVADIVRSGRSFFITAILAYEDFFFIFILRKTMWVGPIIAADPRGNVGKLLYAN